MTSEDSDLNIVYEQVPMTYEYLVDVFCFILDEIDKNQQPEQYGKN